MHSFNIIHRLRLASFAAVYIALLFAWPVSGYGVATASPVADRRGPGFVTLPGLRTFAQIARDTNGIAHILARNRHDLYFLQGYVHAQDRLFQMDISRRLASGTLAELLGPGALEGDVELRTIGLRRAAERSLGAISPQVRADVEAYSEGVNAFVAAHPLPPEYGLLELTQFELWTPLDSVAVAQLIAFQRSFDLLDIELTQALSAAQTALGQVNGSRLVFEDVRRSAPFDPAATIPDASMPSPTAMRRVPSRGAAEVSPVPEILPRAAELGRRYLNKVKDIPLFQRILKRSNRGSSNVWVIGGEHTASGSALLTNDPDLRLDVPSTLYPIHLQTPAINVIGSSFAGTPYVVFGHNRHIAWGITTNVMDVTDVFMEQVMPDDQSPSGLSIVHNGQPEPIIPIPQGFRQNNPADGVLDNLRVVPPGTEVEPGLVIPPATLIVPRRNNGPIIELDLATGTALSVQWTGSGPTRELEAVQIWNQARNLSAFIRGLQFVDAATVHVAYADIRGNIAYFATGKMPVREDLQAGTVNGLPSFFIRNGTGGNEWLPVQNPQPNQIIPFEILPVEEMPQIINPPGGFLVNANNDPIGDTLDNDPLNQSRPGGGIFYLAPRYFAGFRAGRITQLIRERLADNESFSPEDMQAMQADTVMLDAQVFIPFIVQALENAQTNGAHSMLAKFANDDSVVEAVGRLGAWDFTTPTGIAEGYDASDMDSSLVVPPPNEEIASSIAATLYSVWRGRFIGNTIDAALEDVGDLPEPPDDRTLIALRHLLDNFETNQGIGASGVNFFPVEGVDNPTERRDMLILRSLAEALELLAGPKFAAAFGESTDQEDYRWGRLHRLVLDHPLDGFFDIPPAGGAFPPPLAGLPGIPVDGGFGTVDAASHDVRASLKDNPLNEFMFGTGPAHRFIGELGRGGVNATFSLPGGTSGVLGSPNFLNLLPVWLTNDVFPLLLDRGDVLRNAASVMALVPERP